MNEKIQIEIPDDVKYIIDTLKSSNYKGYAVGGCIRDSLLDKEPNDWDITTNASPGEVKSLFKKTYDTGIAHGTVTVNVNSNHYEVTTFRIDGKYEDNRRPSSVKFAQTVLEDLSRRDFTVNSMAYNPYDGLVDPFNGRQDLANRIIRTVGNPDERFGEDALRMLRAIRFSAQLGFEVEHDTLVSIERNRNLILKISSERIRDELTKTIISSRPESILKLRDTHVLKLLLPELDACFDIAQNHPYHIYNVGDNILKSVSSIENNRILRWAMLLHDIGKAVSKSTDEKGIDHFYGHPKKSVIMADEILCRLRFDNKSRETILRLIENHDVDLIPDKKSIRKVLNKVGDDIFPMLVKVQEADTKAQNPDMLNERIEKLVRVKELYMEIKASNNCIQVKDLAIDGKDLMDLGIRQGKEIGSTLSKLLDIVLENPELNTRDVLLETAKEWM